MPREGLDELLREQIAYYRARSSEYDADRLDAPGEDEVRQALRDFRPTGEVLELACGTGIWTRLLIESADALTAVDASPEMLAITAARVSDPRLRLIEADLFDFSPERRYDVVFFGFWLSHVPPERFETFWGAVRDALKPGGRVFFVDDAYRTPSELIEGEEAYVVQRHLRDGRAFRAVKVPHDPESLQKWIASCGWEVSVRPTSGPFFYGEARPA